jgi:hypothetical protein
MAFGSSVLEDESQEAFRRQSKEVEGNQNRSFGVGEGGIPGMAADGFERGLGTGHEVRGEGLRIVESNRGVENENV